MWTQPVGAKFENWTLYVERTGPDVRLVYDVNNVHDNILFVGTLNERSFAAASGSYGSSWRCAPSVMFFSSVAGSFSADGNSLSGREQLTYRVYGGGELNITLEWNATRL